MNEENTNTGIYHQEARQVNEKLIESIQVIYTHRRQDTRPMLNFIKRSRKLSK